ncbi:RES family NAD+ phosphorylase [Vallicoccus soli]|uniref:RES family NAD+ phosphorylase n=1 Tax=Vallicoccus soli TaxID=2339232 RepID=UPI001C49C27C
MLYVGENLLTSACEVFGESKEALLCPNWRVAVLRPVRPLVLFDLTAPGAAQTIGALPALADGHYARDLTQQWARAIYEDQPTGAPVNGVRYRSGYEGGEALALWDSAGAVAVATDANGAFVDRALRDPLILGRLEGPLVTRHITTHIISSMECPSCSPSPSL